MSTFLLDLRQAFRSQLRAPGFLLVAILSLGLGLGMNLAVFAALRAELQPKALLAQPERLVLLGPTTDQDLPAPLTWADFRTWQAQQTVCEAVSAYRTREGVLTGGTMPFTASVGLLDPDLLRVLGAGVQSGRTFGSEDPNGMLLTHALWTSRFGGDPAVLGSTVQLDGRTYSVLGVLPPAFAWDACDCFVPLPSGAGIVALVGRLKPGTSPGQAQDGLESLSRASSSRRARVVRLNELQSGKARETHWLLSAAALGVLLLACLNVGGLLLGRVLARAPEFSLRQAMGATSTSLLGPVLAETGVIAVPGLALGLLLAHLCTGFLAGFLPQGALIANLARLGAWELGFGVLLAAGVSLVCAWVPLRFLPRERLAAQLGSSRTTHAPARKWAQHLALGGQVGLAMAMLSGFMLIQTSLSRLRGSAVGIQTEGRLVATLPLNGSVDPAQSQARMGALIHELENLPGVHAVGTINLLPVLQMGGRGSVVLPGEETARKINLRRISEGYFRAMGIPVLNGRGFTAADMEGTSEWALVSASLARRLGGDRALGSSLRVGGRVCTVAGVVGDVKSANFRYDRADDPEVVYLPGRAQGAQANLVVHSEASPAGMVPLLRERIGAHWPGMPLDQVSTLTWRLDAELLQERRLTWLLALLAGMALALSLGGIYALLNREVLERRREIGLRLSLGATTGRVLTHILRQALRPALLGLALGACASIGLARVLQSQLYAVSSTDLRIHLGVALTLAATATLASLFPALRASRIQPAEALKET
jgi:putative ABC transport system permease protein